MPRFRDEQNTTNANIRYADYVLVQGQTSSE